MNKIYNVVWCAAKGCFQVCSELGKNTTGTDRTEVRTDRNKTLGSSNLSVVVGATLIGCSFSAITSTASAASCPTTVSSATTTSCSVDGGTSLEVTNSGSIVTTDTAVSVTSATAITNDGTISSSDGRGIQLVNSSTLTNGIVNTGTISAAGHAIEVTSGYTLNAGSSSAAIYNSGSIISTNNNWGDEGAIRLQASSTVNGDIVNTSTGTIDGYIAGIYNDGTIYGSILNDGTITGGTYGIYNTGLISTDSVKTIYNAGTIGGITNSGTIQSGSAAAISNDGTITSITNTGSGKIQSWSGDGIYNAGTITLISNSNSAAITSYTADGINNTGTIDGISNSGTISSYSSDGIYNDGTINSITNAGVIKSDYSGYGISNDNIIGEIYNSGTISSTNYYGIDNNGTIDGITNTGTISGYDSGILNDGTIDGITNTETISGSNYGILNYSYIGGIDNSGAISGSYVGILNYNYIDGITNTGTITGSTYSIYNSGTVASDINNYGVLNGNVYLGTATLNLLASATAVTTQPEVNGYISGDSSSIVNVGSTTDSTTFTTNGNANVGTINVASGSTLALSDGNNWYAAGNFTNNGTITLADTTTTSDVTVGAGGTFTNAGTIDLSNNALAGDTLTINGNYVGDNGNLLLDTVLNGASSISDKLVITGDASGTTYVTISNLGGSSSKAIEGLDIIEVDGTSTANAFVQNGRIVAGAYDYSLVNSGDNWYLSSLNASGTQTLRPEAGSYLANLAAANTLFDLSLNDRFAAGKTNSQAVWIKGTTDRTKFKDTTGQISTETDKSAVQVGVDLAQWDGSQNRHFAAGLMTGYGKATSDSDSYVSGYKSKGTVNGYNIGVYATLAGDQANQSNFYVDGWALWNSFNARVNGSSSGQEKYNLSGMSASLETGYAFKVASNLAYAYFIQPKAQLIWSGIDADEHTETNGTKVVGNANNLQSSVGLKAYMANSSTAQAATLQPFVEMNWLHNSHPYAISMDDGKVEQDGSKNIAEFKLGVNGQISPNAGVWLNATSQLGSNDYRNYGVKVGFKYSF